MSILVDPSEFASACDRAMRSAGPADYRRQQAWLDDWKLATNRMRYLKIEQIGLSDSLRSLIRIRGALRRPNLNLEFIKPDVVSLWSNLSKNAIESFHTFFDSQESFECAFLGVYPESYITGSMIVRRFEEPPKATKGRY